MACAENSGGLDLRLDDGDKPRSHALESPAGVNQLPCYVTDEDCAARARQAGFTTRLIDSLALHRGALNWVHHCIYNPAETSEAYCRALGDTRTFFLTSREKLVGAFVLSDSVENDVRCLSPTVSSFICFSLPFVSAPTMMKNRDDDTKFEKCLVGNDWNVDLSPGE